MAVATVLPVAPAAAQGGGGPVLVIGDSLEVGSGPYLRQALAGVAALEIDAERGRTSSEAVRVLGSKLRAEHEVVVFPLGTNDLSASTFAASLAAARELAGGRCMVVATIARPNLRGSSTAELNRVVEQFAAGSGAGGAAAGGAVQVMDWRSAALSTPGVLGRDRVHATGQGYGLRASLLAEAVQGCLLGGDLGGIPAPENPDAKVPDPVQRDPDRPARRSSTGRTQPRPAAVPAAKLPAPELVLALGAMVERVVWVVRPALVGAQAAATKARPEPVLGAPDR